MKTPLNYKFYATLLDSYTSYLKADVIWEKYWGYSENPPHTPEEFRQIQFQSLIDRINRVPYESEAADRGTAFNEVIDCMVLNKNSEKMKIEKAYRIKVEGDVSSYLEPDERGGDVEYTDEVVGVNVYYNNRVFYFPINLILKVARYYKGALPQQYIQAVLPTIYGNVLLYGYIDYLQPLCTHDLKTTGKYSVGKYKDNWQHVVYPYCLMKNGCNVSDFEYDIVELDKSYNFYTEHYSFVEERDVPKLTEHVEDFISFLESNKNLITDRKIFNLA